MPLYDIKNVESGEVKEVNMSYASLQDYLLSGEWIQVHHTTGGLIPENGDLHGKSSGDWNDLLKKIKKGSGRGVNIRHR